MNVSSAYSGSQAIYQGHQQLNSAADRAARFSTGRTDSAAADLTQSAVQLKEASLQVQAGAKAVKAEDGMIGSLLDVHA